MARLFAEEDEVAVDVMRAKVELQDKKPMARKLRRLQRRLDKALSERAAQCGIIG